MASSRRGSARSVERIGMPVCLVLRLRKPRSGRAQRTPDLIDDGCQQPVGQAGLGIGLEQDDGSAREPRQPADARRKCDRESRRNRRSRSRYPDAAVASRRRLWNVPLRLLAMVRKKGERRGARERVACDSVQIVTGLWNDRRLEPIGRADEGDPRAAAAQRVGNCDCRVEMPARAAAGEDDGHARPLIRRCRADVSDSATAKRLTTSELPPKEMKGSGTPVTGHDDETTPILTKA